MQVKLGWGLHRDLRMLQNMCGLQQSRYYALRACRTGMHGCDACLQRLHALMLLDYLVLQMLRCSDG
jgi:hypothetical protein